MHNSSGSGCYFRHTYLTGQARVMIQKVRGELCNALLAKAYFDALTSVVRAVQKPHFAESASPPRTWSRNEVPQSDALQSRPCGGRDRFEV